jgi:hypothetical protein
VTPAEKLALAQRSYAAFCALDVEALIPLYSPHCEWRMGSMGAALGTGAFRGHDGLRELVGAISEGAESYAPSIKQARITREGVLLLAYSALAQSSYTHMDLTLRGWQEAEFRDGLILSIEEFDEPPPGWDDATPLDLGLTPGTGT